MYKTNLLNPIIPGGSNRNHSSVRVDFLARSWRNELEPGLCTLHWKHNSGTNGLRRSNLLFLKNFPLSQFFSGPSPYTYSA